MQEVFQQLQANMELSLEETNLIPDPVDRYGRCIKVVCQAIDEIKGLISSYIFQTADEEIHYFKDICPVFYSKHFYFTKIYDIELLKRSAGKKNLRWKYDHDLREIELFFIQNQGLTKYFYGSLTYLDEQLFTRRNGHQGIVEDLSPVIDPNLTLSTYKVSWIIANQKYRSYLQKELHRLDHPTEYIGDNKTRKDVISLGVSKSYLAEEIVAIQLAELIYVNGQPASLAWLTEQAELLLHTDLKDFKSLDYANRNRKKELTPLLTSMIKKYMDRANRLNK
ncbi:RteC domain-containing protein [Puia sp. P3]|uniref:RteC domain-containing protein n=1 Tax=Puia sp. P3 TaxID=3423952 RepID=UPI003D6690C8